jgi:tight adherence protein B
MNIMFLIPALVAGLAAAVLAWACRDWVTRRFARDVEWMHATYLRFNPEPVDARLYVILYYGGYAALLMLLRAIIPNTPAVLVLWVGSWWLPRVLIGWLWRRRLKKIDGQISHAVSSLANSMRAGLTLVQGITRLSEQAPEPIRTEFKIMANQYGYGADMETVIRNAKTRLALQDFSLFASALLLNREMGGDISETLTRISKSLDKLREMRKTVEAHTSEGRTNIKVLVVAPFFMLAIMSFAMPEGVGRLFSTSQGWAILFVAAILTGGGVYLAARITRSEV